MRFRRKHCLSKIAVVISSTVLVSVILWGSGGQTKISDGGGSGPLSYVFPTRLVDSLLNSSNVFSLGAQKCVSSISNIRITANYTLNSVLDKVKMGFDNGHILALDQSRARARNVNTAAQSVIPDSEPLEIIVIPHSHNDPGWKKTYQKYFDDQTTHILSKIVEKLYQYPDMTFIWVESCFLDKWWSNQTSETKEKFKSLVQSGRLEITSGMWVAPDEASPHYFALLDQMIEGHYWVKKNLGTVPESSLNFDQFGYSATMPYFAKKAGLKNVLIKRIHRGLKELFGKQQNLNFHWRQFWNPDGKDDIFGHVDTYEWMSISDSCGPDRAVCRGLDFQNMPDLPIPGSLAAEKPVRTDHLSNRMARNLHDFTQQLVAQFRLKTANYKHKVMMLPHGGDFRYVTEFEWEKQYKNMKIFMQYVNENKKEFNIHMRFGTLKDYFDEVERQEQKYSLSYPVVSGDFYTYTEGSDYWTGYFTTRQFDKRLGREVLEGLRAAELFAAIAFRNPNFKDTDFETRILSYLESARKNLGVFQHHDAITGTSQVHVVIDYEQLLSSAFASVQKALSFVTEYLLSPEKRTVQGNLLPVLKRTQHNTLTQRSVLPVPSNGTHVILVNSLTQSRREVVTLNVQTVDVVVLDQNGNDVILDFVSISELNTEIKFEVNFPPLSVLVYTLRPYGGPKSEHYYKQRQNVAKPEGSYFCENDIMNVTFHQETASPKVVCYKSSNVCTQVTVDWRYYRGSGGAYTMISQGMEESASKVMPKVKFFKGKTFCGVESDNGYFSFKISVPVFHDVTGRALRLDILSDLSRAQGFVGDLAMRIETAIRSENVYYVDSNGFQLMGRKFRNTLPFDGNVYPMSAMSVLEDDSMRLTVHSAQPHGVVSRTSGKIDFMLDRIAVRPEMDLPEGVRDNKPTKTILYLEFEFEGEYEKSGSTEATLPSINSILLNDVIQHPIYKFFSLDRLDIDTQKYSQSFLYNKLPCDIIIANVKNLVDVTSLPDGTSLTLFRRAVSCSKNITDNFCELYDNVKLTPGRLFRNKYRKVTEMSLSHLVTKQELRDGDDVTLEPMDLKTFHLQ